MIPIQNIYYMLAYSFQPLREEGYKKVATDQFDNVADLCAAILIKGISQQLKKGLVREYISETDVLSGIRGKMDITESIKGQTMLCRQMVCTYDDFTVNTYMNRIIKTTMEKLLYMDITKSRKKAIKKLLVFFDDVQGIEVYSINWKQRYTRNNQTYHMLISICYLVLEGLLQTQSAELSCVGVNKHAIIAIGSHGCIRLLSERKYFISGLKYVVETLKPRTIIVYGSAPHEVFAQYDEMGIEILQFDSEFMQSRKAVRA